MASLVVHSMGNLSKVLVGESFRNENHLLSDLVCMMSPGFDVPMGSQAQQRHTALAKPGAGPYHPLRSH